MEPTEGIGILTGKLSGRSFTIPDVNRPPMPALAPPGVIHNGEPSERFGAIDGSRGYPDVRSFRRKFGLLIPATNTSMEHDLWSIVLKNQEPSALRGVGLHTTNVLTPTPRLQTETDLMEYRKQFLGGLRTAVDVALLAEPQYMIMGMSLEHIIGGIQQIRAPMADIEAYSGLSWATWHDAIQAALTKYDAKRIGILTPFDKKGNEFATQMFTDLGFEVVSSVGFSCAHALHIAHVPDWAKEKAIVELLAKDEHRLDAVVQCGTNMSLLDVSEKLEPVLGIPILGINAVTFWYALRENGFDSPLGGAGRLLREF
ncbi:MAG: putative decarboxylase [Nitrospira sp.]|jgi:maleate isomerase|nr:putative decarboxylase [Nitrospira sp.]